MNKKKLLANITICTALLASAPISLLATNVVHAEQTISSNPIADETTERTLTIWKYQVKDSSELGDRGEGLEQVVDKTPLPGIKFSIQKVTGTNLKNPLKDTYTPVGEAVTVITGEDGSVKHSFGTGTAGDGVYLVTELADDRPGDGPKIAKPADPFFVYIPQTHREDTGKLIYDVEVQPKNILESLLEPDKTIEGEKAYSIKAGEQFDWEAAANIPVGLHQVPAQDMVITPVYDKDGLQIEDIEVKEGEDVYADYFTMSDTLNKQLLLDDVKLQIGDKDDADSWVDLVLGTDYTVTVDGESQTTHPITSATTEDKEVVVNLTQAGMKKVAATITTLPQIRVVYTTHVDKDYNGVIANNFKVNFLSPGLKPVETETPDPEDPENPDPEDPSYPKVYTGGFDILKTKEGTEEERAVLAGAEFHIASSKENADAKVFLASDGKSYAFDAELPTGVTFLKSISDENGLAEFNGLELDVADKKEDIKRSYWVVETKAPAGFELLKEAKEVIVDLSTHEDETIELEVVNKPKTDLPFTGGEGATLLVTIALGAITIGTVAILIDKKRRHV
ncbi:SpaH/EbpB family LPXTG-anchored major pilin [Enterococcus sp. LJL98]